MRVPHPLVLKGAGFSSMRNPLRRYYGRGDLHFVTFSCYRRRPFLGTRRARDHFVKILNQVRSRYRFLLVGYVVMPEHVHLLLSEPKKGNPSKILQVLKQTVFIFSWLLVGGQAGGERGVCAGGKLVLLVDLVS